MDLLKAAKMVGEVKEMIGVFYREHSDLTAFIKALARNRILDEGDEMELTAKGQDGKVYGYKIKLTKNDLKLLDSVAKIKEIL